MPKATRLYTLALPVLLAVLRPVQAEEPERLDYDSKRQQVLTVSSDSEQEPYLAFPSVVRADPRTILISYKRGRSHAKDPGASLEVMRFDDRSKQVVETQVIGEKENLIFQMGEWVTFPNGEIANYVDVQKVADNEHHRTGIYFCRTRDGGETFTPMRKLGSIDGIEYGYAFEAVTVGSDVFMLVMTFPELTGQSRTKPSGGRRYGEVHVIVSGDNGHSWSHIRNLSREFGGIPINESSFVRMGERFVVATRGYDAVQRLHLTDEAFRVLQQVDLSEKNAVIPQKLGRPRLFKRDGAIYLLGRNYTRPLSLALFRIHPETLRAGSYAVLDETSGDAYYAEPYFVEENDVTLLNVITYKTVTGNKPDIVRLEFPWDQIKGD